MSKKKMIYVLMTQTGTIVSEIIKLYTGDEYNHVSIALDENFDMLYSFGRKKVYNPLNGGMIKESLDTGLFHKCQQTKAKLIGMVVSKEQYDFVKDFVLNMYENKHMYKYNYHGLIIAGFSYGYRKDNYYTCSEFVSDCLIRAGIVDKDFFGKVVKPQDFMKIDNIIEIYEGYLRDYPDYLNEA